jgi:CDK5 regulatory subunit-associated protein 3
LLGIFTIFNSEVFTCHIEKKDALKLNTLSPWLVVVLTPELLRKRKVLVMQVERRQLPRDWRKRVHAIQSKVAQAASQLPPGFLADLLGDSEAQLDYQAVKATRDKLKETAERTLFGGMAGPAGVWDKLCKAYEKESAETPAIPASNALFVTPDSMCACQSR